MKYTIRYDRPEERMTPRVELWLEYGDGGEARLLAKADGLTQSVGRFHANGTFTFVPNCIIKSNSFDEAGSNTVAGQEDRG